MKAPFVIADTGALVALLDRSDSHHQWALECLKNLKPPLWTTESVLTEAWHLLGYAPGARAGLTELCRSGVLSFGFEVGTELAAVLELLEKYADTPMDFADACLVRMVELNRESAVWTVDSDFCVYRQSGRKVIPVIAPWN